MELGTVLVFVRDSRNYTRRQWQFNASGCGRGPLVGGRGKANAQTSWAFVSNAITRFSLPCAGRSPTGRRRRLRHWTARWPKLVLRSSFLGEMLKQLLTDGLLSDAKFDTWSQVAIAMRAATRLPNSPSPQHQPTHGSHPRNNPPAIHPTPSQVALQPQTPSGRSRANVHAPRHCHQHPLDHSQHPDPRAGTSLHRSLHSDPTKVPSAC